MASIWCLWVNGAIMLVYLMIVIGITVSGLSDR